MSRAESKVLLASAGTGKTFQLTNRLLALYAREVVPERVLASTFTRKAAGAILERLIRRLCEAGESDKASAKLSDDIGVALDRASAKRLCASLLRDIDRLRISTLDAWFKECVQQAALDFGLPPDWEVSDPQMEQRLCGRALSRALDRPRSSLEWSTLISDLKRGGAESRVHAGLISELARAARFARECTRDAWDFPLAIADLEPSEFEGALLELERLQLPLTQAGKLRQKYVNARAHVVQALRAENWRDFASETLVTRVLDGTLEFDRCAVPADLAEVLRVLAVRAAHHLARLVRAQNRALRVLVLDFIEELDAATLEERRLSFDALPRMLAARAAERVAQSGIDHLLLDEFQDTSGLQWRALEPSVRSTLERDGASFFCVGDVKQSIYAWRDGNPLLLEQLPERLLLPKATMAANYRSSAAVVDFVNSIFETIGDNGALGEPAARVARARFQANFERHHAVKDFAGRVRLWSCAQPEDARLVKPREEARMARGVRLAAELREAQPGWSIAFLVRNKKLVPELLERLKREGLDASGEGGNPLTDSSAVNAALSLLEFADHPADDYLLLHLATSPLAQSAGLQFPATEKQRREAALALRKRWLAAGPAEFLAQLEGVVREHYGAFDQRRFAQLVALAQRMRPTEPMRPARFAERLASERVPDPASSRIRVMTVHGAKGLEFDAVILIDLDTPLNKSERGVVAHRRDGDPRAPHDVVTHTLGQDEALLVPDLGQVQIAARSTRLQEELCVLYVALTRAVHHIELVIDYPGERLDKCSFAGIVLQGLGVSEVKSAGLLWDDDWEQPLSRGAPATIASAPIESWAQAPRIELLAGERSIGQVAPSRLASAFASESRPTSELFERTDLARRRGLLWHAWMERVAWSEDPAPSPAALADWAREAAWGDVDPRETEIFLRALAQPQMHAELSRAETARRLGAEEKEVRLLRERRFAFLQSIEQRRDLVQGAFDRAVVSSAQQRAEIVDFKSDALSESDESALRERAEHYRPQLELYRSALSRLENIAVERISLRVCFLAAGRSIELVS